MTDEATTPVASETLIPQDAVATETAPEPQGPRDLPPGQHWFWGTGRRKTAVARVRIRPGEGVLKINGREVDEFFTEPQHRADMAAPLEATGTQGKLEIQVNVHGGGITGQAGAILLGISRALKEYDPSTESALRDRGFLTTDDRQVERKKYGQRGARRRFQFSKR